MITLQAEYPHLSCRSRRVPGNGGVFVTWFDGEGTEGPLCSTTWDSISIHIDLATKKVIELIANEGNGDLGIGGPAEAIIAFIRSEDKREQ